jgi:hypothetical protein
VQTVVVGAAWLVAEDHLLACLPPSAKRLVLLGDCSTLGASRHSMRLVRFVTLRQLHACLPDSVSGTAARSVPPATALRSLRSALHLPGATWPVTCSWGI